MSEEHKKINVKHRSRDEWDKDSKGYILIRCNGEEKFIEVRMMSYEKEVLADYYGEHPEDIYYEIIRDGHITKLQHAAYLGSELQKAYIALKKGLKYVQDDDLEF
ncbi:MAG: DUF4346 domain-containing protein [Nanoarchaeota archaeon]|nr:DUF4346 domain-containing protein [Nanoarchaeota archaeon]MBU1269855.1 DUF4346 domain-containing protein [Nanoarchaeota archaeon]MBU1605164.1 DUF4346 domain-containing protein [Nanoarchaeota archaeon]MBU2443664.1 DUF4346 domain-containing protein [Nanoarchaeota archaeon]